MEGVKGLALFHRKSTKEFYNYSVEAGSFMLVILEL